PSDSPSIEPRRIQPTGAATKARNHEDKSDRDHMQIEDVAVARVDFAKDPVGRLSVEVDARDGGVRAFEDDVLRLLHVDRAAAQPIEDVREDAGAIAVPDD